MRSPREIDPEWSFTVQLDRAPTDAEADAMFEAGLDDSTISGDLLEMDRQAPTLLGAIASTVSQLREAGGPRPTGVHYDDAVTLSDVAQRLQGRRTTESLRLLAAGRRGPGDFPRALLDTGKIRIYSWAQVSTWLQEVMGDTVPDADPDLALADAALRLGEWARASNRSVADLKSLLDA